MTLTAIGYVVAGLTVVGGLLATSRVQGNRRFVVLAASVALAVIIAWFAWLFGTAV